MTMIFPAVWEGFGGILWYFQETPGLLPGRFTIFNKWQTKLQVRNIPFSNRAFLAHMCPIYRKTAAGSCNGNQRWVEVMNHEFRSEHPTRKTDLLFDDLLLAEIFT